MSDDSPTATSRRFGVGLGFYQSSLEFMGRISYPAIILVLGIVYQPQISTLFGAISGKVQESSRLDLEVPGLGKLSLTSDPAKTLEVAERLGNAAVETYKLVDSNAPVEAIKKKAFQVAESFVQLNQQAWIDIFLDSIHELDSENVLRVEAKLPPIRDTPVLRLIESLDPRNLRADDPEFARRVLLMRVVLEHRTREFFTRWEEALNPEQSSVGRTIQTRERYPNINQIQVEEQVELRRTAGALDVIYHRNEEGTYTVITTWNVLGE